MIAEQQGRLRGIRVSREVSTVSHLLFADDLLLFARAKIQDVRAIDGCMKKYMSWSGQKVSTEKSTIHLSRNLDSQEALAISDLLQLQRLPDKAKHLRLPLLIPRSKSVAIEGIKEKLLSKISGWKMKLLSQASRTTMIRAVASAIPAYPLNFFLMPQSWCAEIDIALRNFWRGHAMEKKRFLML